MHRYSSYNLVEKMLRDLKYEDMLGHFTEWEIDVSWAPKHGKERLPF